MGGVSESHAAIKGGMLSWVGQVKVVPALKAPGFCTVRTSKSFPDMSSADGLLVTAKLGDSAPDGLSKVKISMESSVKPSPRQGEFEASFTLTKDMTSHFIPFSSMTQSWRGQKEGGPPTKAQLKAITGLGLNEDGTAGKFDFVSSLRNPPLLAIGKASSDRWYFALAGAALHRRRLRVAVSVARPVVSPLRNPPVLPSHP